MFHRVLSRLNGAVAAGVLLTPVAITVLVATTMTSRTPVLVPTPDEVPSAAVDAYVLAASELYETYQSCGLQWPVIAAIAKIETDHGRFGGAQIGPDGVVEPHIFGIVLDGSTPGTQAIADTDGGLLDGDTTWDRAVGPFQFIPSTWEAWKQDGDGDGIADPHNIYDAALTAGTYLCSAAEPTSLNTPVGIETAVFVYNNSGAYVAEVMALIDRYTMAAAFPDREIVCPVYPTASFIDSWHFPRSGGRVHKGQDLFAPTGTPLVAVEDGVVAEVRSGSGLGGNIVWLQGSSGQWWYYAHLDSFEPGLRPGQSVSAGDLIGAVGRTGNAATTPPHLHIQWRPEGRHGPDRNPYLHFDQACPGH